MISRCATGGKEAKRLASWELVLGREAPKEGMELRGLRGEAERSSERTKLETARPVGDSCERVDLFLTK